MNAKQVLDLFVEQGIIESGQKDDLLQEINASGKSVCQALVDFDLVNEQQFYQVIAESIGTEFIDLSNFTPPDEVIRLIPAGMARLHGAFPLGTDANGISVCLIDPLNPQTAEDLRFAIGRNIHVVVAPTYQIEGLIARYYGSETVAISPASASDMAPIAPPGWRWGRRW